MGGVTSHHPTVDHHEICHNPDNFLATFVAGEGGNLEYGWLAEANHANGSKADVCDPDYGWLPGAEGTNKCYMLIKGFDSASCYSSDPYGGYGMDWFDAMQCCYFQNSYLAEPLSQAEMDVLRNYMMISNGNDRQNTWWMGATDMHLEGSWLWMSGAPWGFANWNEGEPNQNGNEDCGAFASQAPDNSYKWMALECNSANHGVPHYAVCEKLLQ